jgi:hypothetical protein
VSAERKRVLAVLLLCLAMATGACGGDDESGETPTGAQTTETTETGEPATSEPAATQTASPTGGTDGGGAVAGTWSGTWTNTVPDQSTGTFEIQWGQEGSVLSGTITIEGTPCLTDGSINGALNGNSIAFGVVQGDVQVAYTGSVSGNTMSGTYATDCGNAVGTWEATKTG